jgi:hypothetical protein
VADGDRARDGRVVASATSGRVPVDEGPATTPAIAPVDQLVLDPLRPSVGWYVLGIAVIVL